MSDYQLLIKIAGQLDGSLQSSVKQAQSLLDTLKKGGKGLLDGIASATGTVVKANVGALAAIGAGVAKVTKDAVSNGKEFEVAMSQVAATMAVDKADQGFQQLQDTVLELGRTTDFTAKEVAEGANILAMSGYSSEEIMSGLPTVLNLARAGAIEMGDSAKYITSTLASMRLERTEDNFQHIADVMAKTASIAKTDVNGIGEAFSKMGANGAELKYGVDEFAALAGVLANVNITGSEAGTHIRNMMQSLQQGRNKDAIALLDELGVKAFDDNHEFREMADIFEDLNTAMEGWTDEEKTKAINTIFNKTDRAAAKALLNNLDQYRDILDQVSKSSEGAGAAQEMYDRQTDNLAGDLNKLSSAYEGFTLAIQMQTGSLSEGLRGTVQQATEYVGQLTDAFKTDGALGIATEIGNIFGDVAGKIQESGSDAVNAAFDFVDQLYQSIGSAENAELIGNAAASIVTTFGERFITNTSEFTIAAGNLVTSFTQGLAQEDAGSRIAEALTQAVSSVGDWFSGDNAGNLGAAAGALVTQFATSIAENSGELLSSGVEIVTGIVEGIISGSAALIAAGPDIVAKVAEGITSALPGALVQAGTDIGKALSDSLDDVVESWTGGDLSYIGENLSEDAVQVATESAEAFQAAMQDVWGDASFLTDIGMGADIANVFNGRETLDESQAAIRDYIQGWVDAGATVEEVSDQFNAFWEDQGDIDPRANQNFMDAAKLYEQMYEEAANRAQEASAAVSDATENMEAFGESGAESIDAVSGAAQSIGDVGDSIGEVGDSVTEVAEEMSEAESLITDSISSLGDVGGDTLSTLLQSEDMQGKASEITAAMETVATGVTESISTMQSGVAESMSALAESLSSASEAFNSLTEAASSAASEVAAQMATVASSVSDAMSGLSGVETPEISGDPTAGLDTSTKEITVTMDASGVTAAVAEIQASMTVMGEAANAGSATFSAGMQVVASSAQSTSAAAAAAVMSMVAIMSASFAAAVASAQASAQGIYAAFASIDLAGVAANMMAGLTAGIEAGGAAAVAAAQNIASQVAAAMSSALQINSPSKVTTEIGYYTGMGVPVGLEKSLPETLSTVGSFTGAVTNRMDNSMSAPVAAIAARSKAGTQAAGIQSGGQASFSPVINITINGNATEETAQTIASLTMDQFRRFYDEMVRQDRRVAYA